jgi:hypothetical protein
MEVCPPKPRKRNNSAQKQQQEALSPESHLKPTLPKSSQRLSSASAQQRDCDWGRRCRSRSRRISRGKYRRMSNTTIGRLETPSDQTSYLQPKLSTASSQQSRQAHVSRALAANVFDRPTRAWRRPTTRARRRSAERAASAYQRRASEVASHAFRYHSQASSSFNAGRSGTAGMLQLST